MTEIDSPPRAHLDHVSHSFPGTGELLHGLDVVLTAGEVVAVVGPSGSGKSTLLHLLAGWREPTSGAVRRTGIRSIAWVFQNPHGSARRTALDHVVLPLLGAGRSRQRAEAEARDHLARVELADVAGRQFRYLSGGESQRLMLARAAAREPDLLLVDEPTAQLDPATAATVSAALAQIAHAGRVVVVATHDPQTRDACTRVVDLAALTRPSAPG